MTLPAFLIAGAGFSGAEILYDLLRNNPALFFPKGKPSSFFYRSDFYARGISLYESLFKDCNPHRVPGDMGVQYFERGIVLDMNKKYLWQLKEDSALRVKRHAPETKIILCLRHPLTRAALQFAQARAGKIEKAPTLALALEEELAGKRTPENHPLCYIYRNRYAEHIAHWRRLFGAENIHIVLYEKLMSDMPGGLARTETFIGVRPQEPDPFLLAQKEGTLSPNLARIIGVMDLLPSLKPLQNLILNKSAKKSKPENTGALPELPPLLQERLLPLLAEDRNKLETLIGATDLKALWPISSLLTASQK